jgi:hypothetical protein
MDEDALNLEIIVNNKVIPPIFTGCLFDAIPGH